MPVFYFFLGLSQSRGATGLCGCRPSFDGATGIQVGHLPKRGISGLPKTSKTGLSKKGMYDDI